MSTIRRKNRVHSALHEAVKRFSKGHFDESWSLLATLETLDLTGKDLRNLHKVFNLLILGQLFGLHNPTRL